MSNSIYDTYDDTSFTYNGGPTFDNRTKTYLLSRYQPTIEWDYGDTFTITFRIYEGYDDSTTEIEYLENKIIQIDFYNFRDEIIYSQNMRGDMTKELYFVNIDYDTSINIFKKGTYSCSVTLYGVEETSNGDSEIVSSEVILPLKECILYVG